MTTVEMRIKFENMYTALFEKMHKLTEDSELSEFDELTKMEAAFKRLFWSITKRSEKDNGISYDWLRWRMRHADIVDFFSAYKEYIGIVPNWQR